MENVYSQFVLRLHLLNGQLPCEVQSYHYLGDSQRAQDVNKSVAVELCNGIRHITKQSQTCPHHQLVHKLPTFQMKASLAERHASILRQNAELDQKAEAIEQRLHQNILTSASVSKSIASSVLSCISDEEDPKHEDDENNSRTELKMDISFEEKSEEKSQKSNKFKTDIATRSKNSIKRIARRRSDNDDGENNDMKKESAPSPTSFETDGLGLEATVRYQKARLRVLQDELEVATNDVKEMMNSQTGLTTRIEELTNENIILKKKQVQTQQLLEKQQELTSAMEAKHKLLETHLATAQTKIEELERNEKQTQQQFRSKDVRLNRALEELEKLKTQIQEERKTHGEQVMSRSEYDLVVKENKKLEKQKTELLVAFKKQIKLIDLLKRQRIHMEAAKMISFTEEEFSKTLELG